MIKTLLISGSVVIVVGGFIALIYLQGWWIPNTPGIDEYPIRGFDVSEQQGTVDWRQIGGVAAGTINFVYIRATSGVDGQDTQFTRNMEGARAVGLTVGAYHFYNLTANPEAQAQNFIKAVPKELIKLPPAVDIEFYGNTLARPAPGTLRVQISSYVNAMKKYYGTDPVIYTNKDFLDAYLDVFAIKRLWIRNLVLTPGVSETGSWMFWQYTARARLPGIEGFVPLDVYNGTASDYSTLVLPVAH